LPLLPFHFTVSLCLADPGTPLRDTEPAGVRRDFFLNEEEWRSWKDLIMQDFSGDIDF